MKMTPISQGTGVPSPLANTGASDNAKARALAVLTGQESSQEQVIDTGNEQANKALKTIKMKTQVSPDRPLDPIEAVSQDNIPATDQGLDALTGAKPDTVEQAQAAPEETKPLSPQFAALAKAKRALQIKEAELAKREAELAQKTSPSLDEFVPKAALKTNPLSVLTENGVTYDQLTEALINGQGPNPEITALRNELKATKEELVKQFAERDQLQEQQVLAQIRRDADQLISSSDNFKATQTAKATDQVVELIHRTWKATGEILSVEEAADLVEKQIREEALPFVDLLRPQSTTVQEVQEPKIQVQKPNTKVMRTLTNRDGAMPGKMDRRSRMLAAFYGQKKG